MSLQFGLLYSLLLSGLGQMGVDFGGDKDKHKDAYAEDGKGVKPGKGIKVGYNKRRRGGLGM